MFRAFADFTRLRILHLLAHQELCVAEMMSALRAPQSKVSRHLSHLRLSGLVNSRQKGKRRYYCLAKPSTRFQARIYQCLSECHIEVRLLRQDMERARRLLAEQASRSRTPRRKGPLGG